MRQWISVKVSKIKFRENWFGIARAVYMRTDRHTDTEELMAVIMQFLVANAHKISTFSVKY
jgi:hypothetical protein